MGKIDMDLNLTGLATQAAKLNLDNSEANKNSTSVSRYQNYPFARFNSEENQPDPIDKNSSEYLERVTKVLDALEVSYQKTYTEYRISKADYIAQTEADDQRLWNHYIFNPAREKSPFEGIKVAGFDRIDFGVDVARDNAFNIRHVDKLQRELFHIGRLLRIGRLEKARLEGSDSFVHLRNEWADMIADEIDGESVRSSFEEDSSQCSTCAGHIIYD
ncbi:hypothetical protein ACLX1H_010610 [Fusarium chlamydosporum]